MMNKIIKLPKEVDIIFPKSGTGLIESVIEGDGEVVGIGVGFDVVGDAEVVEGDGEVVGVGCDVVGDADFVEVVCEVVVAGEAEVLDGIVVYDVVVDGDGEAEIDGNDLELELIK